LCLIFFFFIFFFRCTVGLLRANQLARMSRKFFVENRAPEDAQSYSPRILLHVACTFKKGQKLPHANKNCARKTRTSQKKDMLACKIKIGDLRETSMDGPQSDHPCPQMNSPQIPLASGAGHPPENVMSTDPLPLHPLVSLARSVFNPCTP